MKRAVVVIMAMFGATACITPPGGGTPTEPVPPTVSSFTAPGGPFTDPAVVPLRWNVSDANGDDLTCRVDFDGDTTWDVVVPHCQNASGRTTSPTIGSYLAILEVSDGTTAVTSTTGYSVTAGPTEPFNISLRQLGPLDSPVQAAFDAAVTRWQSVVSRGVPDLALTVPADDCLDGAAAFDGTVDDLVIDVAVHPIDGSGNILGQAGPCWVGNDSLSRWGVMEFDSADVQSMVNNGTLGAVIMHEMGHVLGIGTLWNYGRSMLANGGTANPTFTGPRAVAQWSQLGGTAGVPVENNGSPGTTDAHWRESIFDNEMMTGYIDQGLNPLSAMSIASLGDLGYHVDLSQADPYSVPGIAVRAEQSAPSTGTMLRPTPRRAG
jgi:hypothetical protein